MKAQEEKFIEILKTVDKGDKRQAVSLAVIGTEMVNHFGFDEGNIVAAIAEDEQTKANFTVFAMGWVKRMAEAYDKRFYDGRNEQSCYVAHRLMSMESFASTCEEVLEKAKWNPGNITDAMICQHRTLQQSFNKIVFRFLDEELGIKDGSGNPAWYSMPLI